MEPAFATDVDATADLVGRTTTDEILPMPPEVEIRQSQGAPIPESMMSFPGLPHHLLRPLINDDGADDDDDDGADDGAAAADDDDDDDSFIKAASADEYLCSPMF